jgi:hypothetical protein
MWNNVIGRQIGRCNRNLLVVNAGIILIGVIWAYSAQRYLYNCFLGPFPIPHAELVRPIESIALRYFVSLDGLKPVETGLQNIETTVDKYSNAVKSKKVKATYFVAPVEDRFLLIKSPQETPSSTYQGALIPVPADVRSWFQKELLDDKNRRFDDVFIPYLLDSSSFRSDAYIAFAIGLPIMLLAAYNSRKALARIRNMENSPIYRSLKRHDVPPETVAQMIDNEFKQEGVTVVKSLMLSSSWLLHKTLFNLSIVHLNEIIWIYAKVTSHSYNFIPTGKSYGFIVADQAGRMIELDLGRGKSSEREATSFLQNLAAQIPWIIVGYSDELKEEYTKDRRAFVAAVQQRKSSYFNKESSNS